MSKKIVAVNAGPRKGWNTDMLISEAARAAFEKGAALAGRTPDAEGKPAGGERG